MIARFSPTSRDQIEEIWDYLEETRTGLGDEFFGELSTYISLIERRPRGFQKLTENIRRVAMKRFRYHIFYSFDEEREFLGIVEIVHQATDPTKWPE